MRAAFPFAQEVLTSALRIDSPVAQRGSHGTLLHFSLQGSRLNASYYHQDRHSGTVHSLSRESFDPNHTPPYSFSIKENGLASVLRLSAIHFQGPLIRQVSCYTLLSGFRLPWPPSCCLDEGTPFMGSLSEDLGTLAKRTVHPASPVLLTKNGPLGTSIEPSIPTR
jgi:hypothetical protein